MTQEFEFDVFLSHNSEDKPLVELIAKRLRADFGLNPFLDKWNLIPGKAWPNELERALDQSATTAVFLGSGDKGPWHDQEMQRALVKAVKSHEIPHHPGAAAGGRRLAGQRVSRTSDLGRFSRWPGR